MLLVWDELKRQANLDKHGMDFANLDLAFFEDGLIRRGHSGRPLAFGTFEDELIVAVVFVPLGTEAMSIISMRPARSDERRDFHDR